MKLFHVVDLTAQGEIRAAQPYDYATLERIPGAVAMIAAFSSKLYQSPDEFEIPLLVGAEPINFRWSGSAPTAGVATVRIGDRLASISILASGVNADADAITLNAFQRHLTHELHDTGFEPGFGLLTLGQRPLVATVTFDSPTGDVARLTVALADRCFAASYFRFHQLA